MEILNTTIVMETASWVAPALIICAILAIIFANIVVTEYGGIRDVSIVACVISAFAVLIICVWSPQVETDRKRYEAVIDESVSLIEIYEKYDVIEQRGKIWILEDKKN